MNDRVTASWILKLERFLEMKPPATSRGQNWMYWIASVCFAAATPLTFLSAIFADLPALASVWLAQTLLNTMLFGVYFGQGLYEGSFGRFGNDVRQVGRKLRSISIIVLPIFFPFYCAIAVGSFRSTGGSGYAAGAFVGFFVGISLVIFFLLFAAYRCRKNRERHP